MSHKFLGFLLRLSILVVASGVILYAFFWMTDGCPDVQRLAAYPSWVQSIFFEAFLTGAGLVLVILIWTMFWPIRNRKKFVSKHE